MAKRKPRARFWEVIAVLPTGETKVLCHEKKWWDAKHYFNTGRLVGPLAAGSTMSLVRTALDVVVTTIEQLKVGDDGRWVWVIGGDPPGPQIYPSLGGSA